MCQWKAIELNPIGGLVQNPFLIGWAGPCVFDVSNLSISLVMLALSMTLGGPISPDHVSHTSHLCGIEKNKTQLRSDVKPEMMRQECQSWAILRRTASLWHGRQDRVLCNPACSCRLNNPQRGPFQGTTWMTSPCVWRELKQGRGTTEL